MLIKGWEVTDEGWQFRIEKHLGECLLQGRNKETKQTTISGWIEQNEQIVFARNICKS